VSRGEIHSRISANFIMLWSPCGGCDPHLAAAVVCYLSFVSETSFTHVYIYRYTDACTYYVISIHGAMIV